MVMVCSWFEDRGTNGLIPAGPFHIILCFAFIITIIKGSRRALKRERPISNVHYCTTAVHMIAECSTASLIPRLYSKQ